MNDKNAADLGSLAKGCAMLCCNSNIGIEALPKASGMFRGQQPNIDGFLVGGASLKGDSFTTIINSV